MHIAHVKQILGWAISAVRLLGKLFSEARTFIPVLFSLLGWGWAGGSEGPSGQRKLISILLSFSPRALVSRLSETESPGGREGGGVSGVNPLDYH